MKEERGGVVLVLAFVPVFLLGALAGILLYEARGVGIPRTPAQAKAIYERLVDEENKRHAEAMEGVKR